MYYEALFQNPKSIQYINIQKYPEIYEKYNSYDTIGVSYVY